MDDGQILRERTPLHLPLSRYFFPQVIAYILARELGLPVSVWLSAGVSLLVIGGLVGCFSRRREGANDFSKLAFTDHGHCRVDLPGQRLLWISAVSLLLFAGYYEWRQAGKDAAATPMDYPWPASETSLEIEIERLWSNTSEVRIAGLGRVLSAPAHARLEVGDRIAFDAFSEVAWEHPPWVGSRLLLRGVRSAIAFPTEAETIAPFKQHLLDQGVRFRLQQATVLEVIYHAQPRWAERANAALEAQLRRALPEASPLADVYVAMLLGKRVALSDEQLKAFRETGTMHFFAISGLHIKIIALTLFFMLKGIRISPAWSMVLGLCLLGLYVYVTGASPSAVRAFLMVFFFWLGATVSRRQHAPMAAWMNAAFLVLLLDPSTLFLIGFQLSYAVVASIFLFGLPLLRVLLGLWEKQLEKWFPDGVEKPRWMQWLLGAIMKLIVTPFCIGLAAWLASSPLILIHFNLFVPGAVLLNIPLVLLCGGTLITGVLSLSSGLLGLGLIGGILNYAAMLFLWIMTLIVYTGHETWLSGFYIPHVSTIPAIIGLVGFLLLSWRQEKRLSTGAPERKLTSFIPAVFLLALGCSIAIVGAWILI
jgi:competence protein ComEC